MPTKDVNNPSIIGKVTNAAQDLEMKKKLNLDKMGHIREILIELDEMEGDKDYKIRVQANLFKALGVADTKSFDSAMAAIDKNPLGNDHPNIRDIIKKVSGIFSISILWETFEHFSLKYVEDLKSYITSIY